jgi:hypothetical protein
MYVGVGKPEGKRPFGISRRRWEDIIKMDLSVRLVLASQEGFCSMELVSYKNVSIMTVTWRLE